VLEVVAVHRCADDSRRLREVGNSCAAGGSTITKVFVGDGTSLLGSVADGIEFGF